MTRIRITIVLFSFASLVGCAGQVTWEIEATAPLTLELTEKIP